MLLVFPWVPDDLCGGTGNNVVDFTGGVGGTDFVGVAVLRAGGNNGKRFRRHAMRSKVSVSLIREDQVGHLL